jgi:5-methylcytosine-specific restriction endonuclease McrA
MKIVCRPNTKFKKFVIALWQQYYGNHCAYCTSECLDLTLDHVIPRSKGGRNTIANLVVSCRECNELKADRLVKDFRPLILNPIPKEVRYAQ